VGLPTFSFSVGAERVPLAHSASCGIRQISAKRGCLANCPREKETFARAAFIL
jgi:hypothetical protein